LSVKLARQARDESRRNEHGGEHERDRNQRGYNLVHGFARGVAGQEALADGGTPGLQEDDDDEHDEQIGPLKPCACAVSHTTAGQLPALSLGPTTTMLRGTSRAATLATDELRSILDLRLAISPSPRYGLRACVCEGLLASEP
jgi:hypothetical protein